MEMGALKNILSRDYFGKKMMRTHRKGVYRRTGDRNVPNS